MRTHSNKNVDMIRHAIYLEHFVIICLEYACNILVKFLFPFLINKGGPISYCKYKMNMNLGIAIGHIIQIIAFLDTNRSYGTKLLKNDFSTYQLFLRNKFNTLSLFAQNHMQYVIVN